MSLNWFDDKYKINLSGNMVCLKIDSKTYWTELILAGNEVKETTILGSELPILTYNGDRKKSILNQIFAKKTNIFFKKE